MGDWSNNLEYEQREHYGHFYDTDEDVHEEEETDDLISKQKVLNTLDFADNALTDEERTVENYKELLTECIKVLPSSENDGDLISRQAVLETIDSRIEQIKKNTNAMNKSYPHLSFAEGVHDGYCRLKCDLRILPSVSVSENPNKWIPVSDRLPEKNRAVLTYVDTGASKTYCLAYWKGEGWEEWIGCRMIETDRGYKVLAWMPLPEPYKAESEDKE